jgi:glycosyltransferase involved in cell wall biosynthesis
MRILLLNHNVAWSGGTFFRAYYFGREFVRRGHEVTLLSISVDRRWSFESETRDGVVVAGSPDLFWGRGRTGWDPWDCFRRILRTRQQQWDLIHAFDSRPAVILPAIATKAPLVLDWADWWGRGGTIEERPTGAIVRMLVGPMETYFEEAFRIRADATTVISSALEKRAVQLGVKPDTILRLPQGCDVEGIVPRERVWSRRQLSFSAPGPVVGYVGVLNRSDAQLLFDTWRLIRERRADARLILIGNPKCDIPNDASIIRSGFVSRDAMTTLMAACDVMILPLKDNIASRGRWPSKLNDYLAAGRPTVATAVGDCRELFANYPIGQATVDEPSALAATVLALLDQPEECRRMGEAARRLAEEQFAWPVLAARLDAHYKFARRASAPSA